MDRADIGEGGPTDAAELTALAMRSKAYWGYDLAFMEACRKELAVPREAFEREIIRVAAAGGAMPDFTAWRPTRAATR